jgi:hypothetical protein
MTILSTVDPLWCVVEKVSPARSNQAHSVLVAGGRTAAPRREWAPTERRLAERGFGAAPSSRSDPTQPLASGHSVLAEAGWVRWFQVSVIVMVSPSAGIRNCVDSIPAALASWRSAGRVTGA